jgi:biotin carboxylase
MIDKIKTIMMIGGGIQEIPAVKYIQSIGYKVIVTDKNVNSPCFKYSDYQAVIDGRDIEELIAFSLMNKDILNIVGVFTLTELVTSVAAVASSLNLPSISMASAVACQNKNLCKKMWEENNISTPRGGVAKTLEEAEFFFKKFNHNIFVKPLVGFGGKDSRKINSFKVLSDMFTENKIDMIVEELIEGSMHDVKFHPMGVVDRFFLDDFPVEKQISSPSVLDKNQHSRLYKLFEDSVRALGINWGPVKGDAVLSNDGFKILEVAPRLHGPKNSLYLLPYTGFNCLQASIPTIAGDNNIEIKKVVQKNYAVFHAVMPIPGKDFILNDVQNAKSIKEVKEVLIFKNDKETINSYKNATDVPAYILTTGTSYENCIESIEKTGFLNHERYIT